MSRSPNVFGVIEAFVELEQKAADFIANGPSDGIGGYVRDQYRKRCDQFANASPWAQALLGPNRGALNRVCTPYWDGGGFDGPTVTQGITGGQCDTTYLVTLQATRGNGTVDPPFTRPAFGPIGPARFSGSPAQGELRCAAINASVSTCASLTGGAVTYRPVGLSGTAYDGGSLAVLSVSRCDAQPDDCGDLEPELEPGDNPPPDPGPTPGDDPTQDPENPDGPPLLPIPPYDDPVGGPTDVVAEPDPTPAFDPSVIPGDPDTQIGGPESYGPTIGVDPGPGGGGTDTLLGPPPEGRVWVGVLLTFTAPATFGAIAGSAPANTVFPRVVGNASLRFPSARGTAIRVNSRWVTLIRPSGALRVDGVYVNVFPGVTYTVRGISVEECPPNPCSEET